ncbi:hypothetical protein CDEST_12600 [Colletotrichum destructivum]|uniref:Uncharacterized protein n=1 Tax=Colletotrichum destructivum TaxID=34406 RepID=A0AAX4IWK4_9PEZI|nr:hypothetical protein CDEST_12600 [Colletotrichum destructivum]
MADKDPESASDQKAQTMAKEAKDLLEMHADMLKKEPDKSSSTLVARKLRNVAHFCKAMRDCGDDEAALNHLYN